MSLPVLGKRTILDLPSHKDVEVRHGKHVMPSHGDLHLRCGKCGSTDFTIHVRVVGSDTAQITTAVCNTCAKLFAFNDQGQTGGSLTTNRTNGYNHRKAINQNHETD